LRKGWLYLAYALCFGGAYLSREAGLVPLQYVFVGAALVAMVVGARLLADREIRDWVAIGKQVKGAWDGRDDPGFTGRFGDAPWSGWDSPRCTHLISGAGRRPPFWLFDIEYKHDHGESIGPERVTFAAVKLSTDWGTALKPVEASHGRIAAQNGQFVFVWEPRRYFNGAKLDPSRLPNLLEEAYALARGLAAR
jgi:hypothetical protein